MYGVKSSGADFIAFLAERLEFELDFKPSIADPDAWLRPAVKPDGEKYYEYILPYVNDVMAITYDPGIFMNQIQEKFEFKGAKCNDFNMYLGARISKKTINTTTMWSVKS